MKRIPDFGPISDMTLAAASGWAVLWLSCQQQQAKGTSLCLLWEVAEIPCVKLGEVRVAPMQVDGAVQSV